jgi:hypothetical protein
MNKTILFISIVITFIFSTFKTSNSSQYSLVSKTHLIEDLSSQISFIPAEKIPSKSLLHTFFNGYLLLKNNDLLKHDNIITIIDFTLPSTEKRMWIYDVENQKLLKHTYVAHGKNTGDLYAQKFSNTNNSYQSSLGFYVTGDTYHGKHGLSLYLEGLEKEINDKAKERAIVLHGADYVSEDFIKKYGRLGRSFGCPSVSNSESKEIIETISNGSCLFIYYPDEDYLKKSKFVNFS